jgi:hypothetical protein
MIFRPLCDVARYHARDTMTIDLTPSFRAERPASRRAKSARDRRRRAPGESRRAT